MDWILFLFSAYLFRGDSLYNNKATDPEAANNNIERVYVYDPFCPLHGSRRRMISRRTKIRDLDYHLTSIESVDDTESSGVILLRKGNLCLCLNFKLQNNQKLNLKSLKQILISFLAKVLLQS